jgi:hypothetical protein
MAMDEDEIQVQRELHDAIEEHMRAQGSVPEGHILSGWVICFETASMDGDNAVSGHLYGPHEMTTWRALGLVEWIRRFSLQPGTGEDDDDEDE